MMTIVSETFVRLSHENQFHKSEQNKSTVLTRYRNCQESRIGPEHRENWLQPARQRRRSSSFDAAITSNRATAQQAHFDYSQEQQLKPLRSSDFLIPQSQVTIESRDESQETFNFGSNRIRQSHDNPSSPLLSWEKPQSLFCMSSASTAAPVSSSDGVTHFPAHTTHSAFSLGLREGCLLNSNKYILL